MVLKDTIELMTSENYKERFKGEYYQLIIRIDLLSDFLESYYDRSYGVKPTCSFSLLHEQLNIMLAYKVLLEERARIEKVDLTINEV